MATRLTALLLTLAVILGVAWYSLYQMPGRLLYSPELMTPAQALALGRELRLTPWPDAQVPRGWLRETTQTTRGLIVLFHGNAGHALQRSWFADELEILGYRTLLAEYPGYGSRDGAITEHALVADATRLLTELDTTSKISKNAGRLIVAGESLGAGVAAAAIAAITPPAADKPPQTLKDANRVDAVWLITPWNDLASVAAHHYPLLPIALMLREHYDNAAHLQGYAGPTLVLAAGQDEIIPPHFAHQLFDSLGGNKQFIELPVAGHNDWSMNMTPSTWRAVIDYLDGKPVPMF